MGLSVVVWAMIGIALWHFAVLVPDRFRGGIIGAFLAALAGAIASGLLLPEPGIPTRNPPGVERGSTRSCCRFFMRSSVKIQESPSLLGT